MTKTKKEVKRKAGRPALPVKTIQVAWDDVILPKNTRFASYWNNPAYDVSDLTLYVNEDPVSIEQMASSMRDNIEAGKHPINIPPTGHLVDGKFEIADGSTRYLVALKVLTEMEALDQFPKLIGLAMKEKPSMLDQVASNIIRRKPSYFDTCVLVALLIKEGHTPKEVCAKLGIKKTKYNQMLTIGSSEPVLQQAYRKKQLTLENLVELVKLDIVTQAVEYCKANKDISMYHIKEYALTRIPSYVDVEATCSLGKLKDQPWFRTSGEGLYKTYYATDADKCTLYVQQWMAETYGNIRTVRKIPYGFETCKKAESTECVLLDEEYGGISIKYIRPETEKRDQIEVKKKKISVSERNAKAKIYTDAVGMYVKSLKNDDIDWSLVEEDKQLEGFKYYVKRSLQEKSMDELNAVEVLKPFIEKAKHKGVKSKLRIESQKEKMHEAMTNRPELVKKLSVIYYGRTSQEVAFLDWTDANTLYESMSKYGIKIRKKLVKEICEAYVFRTIKCPDENYEHAWRTIAIQCFNFTKTGIVPDNTVFEKYKKALARFDERFKNLNTQWMALADLNKEMSMNGTEKTFQRNDGRDYIRTTYARTIALHHEWNKID